MMVSILLFAVAVEVTGTDIEVCTQLVQNLFAVLDERNKAVEDIRAGSRLRGAYDDKPGGLTVERIEKKIAEIRAEMDAQQCTVKFVEQESDAQ